jgi:hypothetical protein
MVTVMLGDWYPVAVYVPVTVNPAPGSAAPTVSPLAGALIDINNGGGPGSPPPPPPPLPGSWSTTVGTGVVVPVSAHMSLIAIFGP